MKGPPLPHCSLCGFDGESIGFHTTDDWRRRNEAVRLILHERDRQDAKWGEQNHAPEVWLTILGEEFGEACQAALTDRFIANSAVPSDSASDLRKEIIQVAAVAIAMLEWMNRTGCGR